MNGYLKNIALCKRNHIPTFNLDVTNTHLICRIVQTSQITNSLPWEQKKKKKKRKARHKRSGTYCQNDSERLYKSVNVD